MIGTGCGLSRCAGALGRQPAGWLPLHKKEKLHVAVLPARAPLQAFSVQLTPECLADIEQVFRQYRDPAFN